MQNWSDSLLSQIEIEWRAISMEMPKIEAIFEWMRAIFCLHTVLWPIIKMRRNQVKVRNSMNITLCGGVHDSATDKHVGRLKKPRKYVSHFFRSG